MSVLQKRESHDCMRSRVSLNCYTYHTISTIVMHDSETHGQFTKHLYKIINAQNLAKMQC
jgi:hypothetical protein